ncbi:MAG: hypothetical protein U9R08_02990 [Nanoarchaeota archaeon]|nr:hypothetical protein [Nanoarchaeota archaeon]
MENRNQQALIIKQKNQSIIVFNNFDDAIERAYYGASALSNARSYALYKNRKQQVSK